MGKHKSKIVHQFTSIKNKALEMVGEERILEKPQSGISFKMMSFMFKIRNIIRPRSRVLEEIDIKNGFHVLDFGCGPGGYILPLVKLTGSSGQIYALDMNPAAILTVKSIAAEHQLNNIQTILSDGATGLPDKCIDVVLLYDIFHYLNKPDDILVELHRILKPEGILSVSDHHMKRKAIISRISDNGLFKLVQQSRVLNFSIVSR